MATSKRSHKRVVGLVQLLRCVHIDRTQNPWLIVKIGDNYWTPTLEWLSDSGEYWFCFSLDDFLKSSARFIKPIRKVQKLDGHSIDEWEEYIEKYKWILLSPIGWIPNGTGHGASPKVKMPTWKEFKNAVHSTRA